MFKSFFLLQTEVTGDAEFFGVDMAELDRILCLPNIHTDPPVSITHLNTSPTAPYVVKVFYTLVCMLGKLSLRTNFCQQ